MKKISKSIFILFLVMTGRPCSVALCGNTLNPETWQIANTTEGAGTGLYTRIMDPLLFPKDNYTVETKTVKTSSGEKKITYHSFMHILYVAKPVDKDYQSLNVSVPVEIGGIAIDARDAPVFFEIGGFQGKGKQSRRRHIFWQGTGGDCGSEGRSPLPGAIGKQIPEGFV